MPPEFIAIIAATVMILGFPWNLHRDEARRASRHRGACIVTPPAWIAGLLACASAWRVSKGCSRGSPAARALPRPHSGGLTSEPPFAGLESTRFH